MPSLMNPTNVNHLSQNVSSQTDGTQQFELIGNPHVEIIIE